MWPCLISFNKTVRDPRQLRLLALNIRDKYRQLTTMLSMLAFAYGKIVDLRNKLYDKGIFEVHDLGARSISIGNITTGGTGKTPLVAYVAGILAARGEKVCVLTRGYGRRDESKRVLVSDGSRILADVADTGDEPYELAQELLGKAIVIADADRVSAGEWARRKFGVTVFVLDDAFQHRKVKRDVDIVCVDATNPFGSRKMLPSGRLREPTINLARADIVVITRADLATAEKISDLKSEISNLNRSAAIFTCKNEIVRVTPLAEFHAEMRRRPGERQSSERIWQSLSDTATRSDEGEICISAFCALGNPDAFFVQLLSEFEAENMEDFDLSIARSFPDHHHYTQLDVDELEAQAKQCRISAFLTTAKDAAKLSNLKFQIPCYVAEIEVVPDDPERFASIV